jgi:hypothetical protein
MPWRCRAPCGEKHERRVVERGWFSLPGAGWAAGLGMLLIAASQAKAGPPFVTDDPEPVDYGHWEVYGFSAGAYRVSDFTGVGPSMEVNYGALPNLQLHMILNTVFDTPAGQSAQWGVGDTELGMKYRLVNPGSDDWFPEIGVFPLLEVPTGNARRALGSGHLQEFLPVWLQKNFAKWTTYGGGGYLISPGADNRNSWFAGWLVQRQVTDKLAVGVEIFHQTSIAPGRDGTSGFNVGGIYDFTDHYHLLLSVGRGALQYAVDAGALTRPFTYYAAFQWTF